MLNCSGGWKVMVTDIGRRRLAVNRPVPYHTATHGGPRLRAPDLGGGPRPRPDEGGGDPARRRREAHGPHLPLATDVVIAEAMARAAAARLATRGYDALLLPPLAYTAAEFAARFPGTVSLRPATVTALLVDVARSLGQHGFRVVVVANAHLDPAHVAAIEAAVGQQRRDNGARIVFPDVTKRPWALRLTEEFRSGACHAGQYESSIVMAARPELVREAIRRSLPANPRALSTAI